MKPMISVRGILPQYLRNIFILTLACVVPCSPFCVTCHDFSTDGNGFTSSPQPGTPCDPDYYNCAVGLKHRVGFLESLHPGVLTRQENGRLLISGIVQGSPASQANVQLGDEIVSVNGSQPGLSCGATTWESSLTPGVAHLQIARGGVHFSVSLRLTTVKALIANAWSSNVNGYKTVAYKAQPAVARGYSFGLEVATIAGSLTITNVLTHSPADDAGLVAGDRIISINKLSRKTAGLSSGMKYLSPTSLPTSLTFTVKHDNSVRTVYLNSIGPSGMLLRLASPEAHSTNKLLASN